MLIRVLLFCSISQWAIAENINVAVASNFTAPMRALVSAFEQASGHQVRLSFGSSGKFYAQIRHGAPFQAFFSADQTKPIALENDDLIVPGSRFTYAIGALALWSSKPDFVDEDLTRLNSGKFNKLALANPKLAPYGAAAVQVLEHLQLTAATRAKWVQGENIAQTYQFVSTGNADLGFVALSQLLDDKHIKRGSTWIIPTELYEPIRQDAVLLKRGETSKATQALLDFVRSQAAQDTIKAYGYQTP